MVSVIIPTHNRQELVSRAIVSAVNQCVDEPIEIIVVSDGSTDNTKNVVKELGYPNVKFIEYFPSKNGNYARNVGISNASGDYIAFLDDDDEWLPNKLSKQIEAMRKDGAGLCYSLSNIVYYNENISYISNGSPIHNSKKEILFGNFIGSTSTVVVKKEILKESGLFDESLPALQDYDLWIRICQITKICAINEPLINYYNYLRAGNNSNQISSNINKYIMAFDIIEEKYKNLYVMMAKQEIKEKNRNKYILLANKCLRNGIKHMARKYALKLLKNGNYKDFCKFYICSFFSYKKVLKWRSTN